MPVLYIINPRVDEHGDSVSSIRSFRQGTTLNLKEGESHRGHEKEISVVERFLCETSFEKMTMQRRRGTSIIRRMTDES